MRRDNRWQRLSQEVHGKEFRCVSINALLPLPRSGANGQMSESEVTFNNGASEHLLIVVEIHETSLILVNRNKDEMVG